jgi:hypothetical protein
MCFVHYESCGTSVLVWAHSREKSPIIGRFPNMGKCIISYQEVLPSELKNVNHKADEVINHITNGQLLKTSVLTGCLCFSAL